MSTTFERRCLFFRVQNMSLILAPGSFEVLYYRVGIRKSHFWPSWVTRYEVMTTIRVRVKIFKIEFWTRIDWVFGADFVNLYSNPTGCPVQKLWPHYGPGIFFQNWKSPLIWRTHYTIHGKSCMINCILSFIGIYKRLFMCLINWKWKHFVE